MKKYQNIVVFLLLKVLLLQGHYMAYAQNVVSVELRVKEMRKSALEQFQSGNFRFIDANQHIQGFYILNAIEQELLSLVQGNYTLFFELIESHIDMTSGDEGIRYQKFRNNKFLESQYEYPGYYPKRIQVLLEDEVLHNSKKLKADIVALNFADSQCEFLAIYIDNIDFVRNHYHDNQRQFELHSRARKFNSKHNVRVLNSIVHVLHGDFFEPNRFGGDYSFTSGFGQNTGNLDNYFRRTGSFTLELKFFWYANFIGARLGFYDSKVRNSDFTFENELLQDVNKLQVFHYDFFVGRKIDLTRRFSLVPNLGYSLGGFFFIKNPGSFEENPNPIENDENDYFKGNAFFGLDLNYHFYKRNVQKTQTLRFKRRLGYSSPYFVAGVVFYPLAIHEFEPILRGNTFSFQFGFGVHFRSMKKSLVWSL